jgi:hypothetical protein
MIAMALCCFQVPEICTEEGQPASAAGLQAKLATARPVASSVSVAWGPLPTKVPADAVRVTVPAPALPEGVATKASITDVCPRSSMVDGVAVSVKVKLD